MHIISGKYKGKKLKGFSIDGTRPTMNRVKESLFATIQTKIEKSVCLDLFAGSGSLGIEALSMNASKCYFVDNGKIAIMTLKENLDKIENATIIKKDYLEALSYFKKENITFDLIFLDPPYDKDFLEKAITKIEKENLLNKDGLLICEFQNEKASCSFKLIREKKYGDKYIRIFVNEN